MVRIVFMVSACLIATCLVCGQVFAGKPQSRSTDSLWSRWLKQEKRSVVQALWEEIQKTDLPHWQIIIPQKGTPKFFRAVIVQELYNDLLTYLDEWLESQGFQVVPKVGGYRKGTLPEDPVDDFLNYVAAQDAVLFPSLVHLIHIARSDESPLDEQEQIFLNYRLKWLEQVLLPEGMHIDWPTHYKILVEEYQQEWQAGTVQIPQASTLTVLKARAAAEKPYARFLQENLCQTHYVEELAMKTSWNAATSLHRKCMRFADKRDPLLAAHLRFALAASIFGPYLTQEDRRLIVYWLKWSEINSQINGFIETLEWAREISQYQLPGAQLRVGDFKFAIKQLSRARGLRRTTSVQSQDVNKAGNTVCSRERSSQPTCATKATPELAPIAVSKAESKADEPDTVPVTAQAKTWVETAPPLSANGQGEHIKPQSYGFQPMVPGRFPPPRLPHMPWRERQVVDNRRHPEHSLTSVFNKMTGPPRLSQQQAQPRPYSQPRPPFAPPYPIGVGPQMARQLGYYPRPDYQPYVPGHPPLWRGAAYSCSSGTQTGYIPAPYPSRPVITGQPPFWRGAACLCQSCTQTGYIPAPYRPRPVVTPRVPAASYFHRTNGVGNVSHGRNVSNVVGVGSADGHVNTEQPASSMFVFKLDKPLSTPGSTRARSR